MRTQRLAWLALLFGVAAGVPSIVRAEGVPEKYLPPDTEVVVTINVQQLYNSTIAKENKDALQQVQFMLDNKLQEVGASKYLEKAGIDLHKDITSITAAGPGTKDNDRGVILFEGKFNPAKLHAAAEDAAKDNPGSINLSKIGNTNIYEVPLPDGKTVYVGALGNDMLLATISKDVFKATQEQGKSGKSADLPKGLQSLLPTINSKQSFSMAATGPALARIIQSTPVGNNDQANNVLRSIEGLSLALTLTKDLQFQLGIFATDKEAAENFAKMGNGGLIMARNLLAQKAKEEPKLAPAVEVAQTLRIVSQGTNVVLRGEVSYETLGKIIKEAQKNR